MENRADSRFLPDREKREAAAMLVARFQEAWQHQQHDRALQSLEEALRTDPSNAQVVRLFREIERQLGENYRNIREDAYLTLGKQAFGTPDWTNTFRCFASFWDAPRIIEWVRDVIFKSPQSVSDQPGQPCLASFIVPVYENTDYLQETLESIRNQTDPRWEIVLVDDGSSMAARAGIEELAAPLYDRIHLVRHEQNCGLPAARNTGANHAKGEFLVFLDADDLVAPTFLESTLSAAEEYPEAGWIAGMTVQFGQINRLFAFAPYNLQELVQRNQFNCTSLVRKTMFDDLGGLHEEMRLGFEDWEFWVRASLKGYRPVQLPEPLFFYRRQNDSMLAGLQENSERFIQAKRQIIRSNPSIYREELLDQTEPADSSLVMPERVINREAVNRVLSIPNPLATGKTAVQATTARLSNPDMRILFVCHDFPPHRYAGAQLYALQMAKQLTAHNIHVDVLYPLFRGEPLLHYTIQQDNFEGLNVFQLPKPSSHEHQKYINEDIEKVVSDWLQGRSYDLVHVHGLGQMSASVLLALKNAGLPTLMTLHDFWLLCDSWHMVDDKQRACSGPETPEKCANCYLNRFLREFDPKHMPFATDYQAVRRQVMSQSFQLLDMAVAPSQFLADRFARYGMTGVRVHRNGLRYQEPVPKPSRSRPVFGFFGQVILRKGVDLLVQAFAHPGLKDCRLELHGKIYEQDYGARVMDVVDRLPNVTWHGPYEPEKLPELYATVDVAVVPSRMDNYPTTVLEAFMNRTPVIGSRVGGIPEMVEHDVNGLLFESESVESLQEQLLLIANDPQRAQRYAENTEQPRTVESDVEATLKLYDELLSTSTAPKQQEPVKGPDHKGDGKKPLKVVFLFLRNVHVPVLMSILKRLAQDARIDIELVSPPETSERKKLLQLGFPVHDNADQLNADVGFMADNFAQFLPKCRSIINVGHGLISKGQYFTDAAFTRRENLEHLLCVPGMYHRDRLLQGGNVHIPVEVTGFSKLDRLFNGSLPSREAQLRSMKLDPSKKVILYAPTFNISLSAIPIVWMRIRHLATEDRYLLIKLHGGTMPAFREHHEKLAETHDNIIMLTDIDITPYLAIADVVVSDVSSVAFEAMLLDKPVALFSNPNAPDYANYDPKDMEWAWRDMAHEANDLEELLQAVDTALEHPEANAERRAYYRELLQIPTDGRAAERIVNQMWRLVQGDPELRGSGWNRNVAVLFHSADRLPSFEQLQFMAQTRVHPYVLDEGNTSDNPLPEPYRYIRPDDLEMLDEEYILLHDNDFTSADRWLFHLLNHLDSDDTASGVVPRYLGEKPPQGLIPVDQNRNLMNDPEGIPPVLLGSFQGQHVAVKGTVNWRCGAWKRDSSGWKAIRTALQDNREPRFDTQPLVTLDVLLWKQTVKPEPHPPIKVSQKVPRSAAGDGKRERLIRHYQQKGNLEKAKHHLQEALDAGEDSPGLRQLVKELNEAAVEMSMRVNLLFFKNVHVPVLLPIWEELQRRGGFDCSFTVYPYDRNIRAGFPPEEEQAFRKAYAQVSFVDAPRQWRPEMAFMADNVAPLLKGCGKIVNVGHGLLSKGQYFTDRDIIQRENDSDLLCVPGPYHRERLLSSGKVTIPVEATGFPKLDSLFRSAAIERAELFRMAGLDASKKVILFAPTFNMELSAIPMLWMRVAELAGPDRYLVIKLHGSTLPEFKRAYRELGAKIPNVIYVEDQDIAPWMLLADVMLTDVSSVMMEFIALNKPVVLFNNPNTHTYVNYDPRDIEYVWRDKIGIETTDLDEVKQAIDRSLQNPGEYAAARQHYADQLLADRTGNAAANVVDAALRVVHQAGSQQFPGADTRATHLSIKATQSETTVDDSIQTDLAGRLRMARHFLSRGKFEQAAQHLDAARQITPDHPEVRQLVQEVESARINR